MRPDLNFNPESYKAQLLPLLKEIITAPKLTDRQYFLKLRQYPKTKSGFFSKSELINGFRYFATVLNWQDQELAFLAKIKKKPARTLSGVTPVTVLTKPFPCPGKCIFCPSDVRMPKSYLSDEPGAQRAASYQFDPYLQTYNRLLAFKQTGHGTSKIEIIVLGGTWSFYPEPYQIWFIKRCFEALNDFGAGIDLRNQIKEKVNFDNLKTEIDGANINKLYNQIVSDHLLKDQGKLIADYEVSSWPELESAHKQNETSLCRCVGLVLETRPDHISKEEVVRLRRLGATKTQIGIQSLSDEVLNLNHRGHDVAATRRAFKLLRLAGFKIHAHWMPNLYGSNPKKDQQNYLKLFNDPDFQPDELKIYPCSLIKTAELMKYYNEGLWKPYTEAELMEVLRFCLLNTPRYCRLTRIIRDIPSDDIVTGNIHTNFRQMAESSAQKSRPQLMDIRSREIKNQTVKFTDLNLNQYEYTTSVGKEIFLEFMTNNQHIAGFLRLSLPRKKSFIPELENRAIIREVHVYGQALDVGSHSKDKAQHLGLGNKLISEAKKIASRADFNSLAVISSIGTKEYYRKQGFEDGNLYQFISLSEKI